MHVHCPLVDIHISAPDAIEQLLARIDAAGIAHEIFEQAVFGGPEMDFLARTANAMGGAVELDIARLEYGGAEGR